MRSTRWLETFNGRQSNQTRSCFPNPICVHARGWPIISKDRALAEALRVLQHGRQLGGERRLGLNLLAEAGLRERERESARQPCSQ